MKKRLLLLSAVCILLGGCSASSESTGSADTSGTQTTTAATSAAAQESEESGDSSEENIPAEDEFEYKNVRYNPFYLEQAQSDAADESVNVDIDDSEDFDNAKDMVNSVWGEYFSRKTGTDKDKLLPIADSELTEGGCTAHLDCYYVYYEFNKQYYGVCITTDKYKDIKELYDKEYSQEARAEGFSLEGTAELDEQRGIIIDTFKDKSDGVMLACLNENGYEYQVFSYDSKAEADDLIGFMEHISF